MADQKRWFKVWATILNDPDHMNLNLADAGRWLRLGAYLASVGNHGTLHIVPPAKFLLNSLECENLSVLKDALLRLPNVYLEEGKSDNGEFTVIMQKWSKYQEDSTVYQRIKRLRSKRREEEIRGEKKRKDITTRPQNKQIFIKPTPQEVEEYAKSQNVDIVGEKFVAYYEARGWMLGKTPIKNWKACVKTWKFNAEEKRGRYVADFH